MTYLLAVLWRAAAFFGLFQLSRLMPTPPDVVGINVALGLLVFTLYVLTAGVWASADALIRPGQWVARVWLGTALLVAATHPLLTLSEAPEHGVVWSDYLTIAPFVGLLVGVPAAVMGSLSRYWVNSEPD
ncbi:MAG: hypothetical protein CSA58_11020 [Micrococcales bacterium]|nr:MAG: hypothetical protein CSB46_00680 [Micrococcales bacterium]PIE26149.1 MAG: hypothetical protein CSA58_11020 [Micrococcales bacterium]